MIFTYQAKDSKGSPSSGKIEAGSRRDALRILATRGLRVSFVAEAATGATAAATASTATAKSAAPSPVRGRSTPRRSERLPFLESLHDLTASGLSAGEAVRLLSVRLKEPALRSLCQGIWERVSEGSPISRAMEAFPGVFDASTINLIAAGEATGSLNETLSRVIAHLEEQRALRRQLASALAYPVLILTVALGVILFFLFYLLPRMQSLLSTLGGKMPASTQLLIGTADFALHYGAFILAGGAFLAVSLWRWRATETGRLSIDTWMLSLPYVSGLVTSQTVLAISQNLSVLLENGITTAEALRMTERQISNLVHRAAFSEAVGRVLEGESLSLSLGRTRCFPDLVLDRLAVGENTGNVVPSLKNIARGYQARISRQLHGATTVLAGGIMAMVFAFVGFIAFAIVSAVLQLSASFSRGG